MTTICLCIVYCVVTAVQALGAADDFVSEAKARLHYPKAIVGKTLLNMLRLIYKNHAQPRDVSAVHTGTTITLFVHCTTTHSLCRLYATAVNWK
jgi:hypothetical protein